MQAVWIAVLYSRCISGLQLPTNPRVAELTKPLQSGLFALSVGVLHALTPDAAVAISADDYNSMYQSSATSNQGGFSMNIPKIDVPKRTLPSPSIEAPSLPSFDIPKVDLPKAPEFSAPSFSAPSFSLPSFGGSDATTVESGAEISMEDREAIDATARATAQDFRRADAAAKEVESKARALRKVADEKKAVAKEAKDAACEYRPGGKFLCIRGFNSGF